MSVESVVPDRVFFVKGTCRVSEREDQGCETSPYSGLE